MNYDKLKSYIFDTEQVMFRSLEIVEDFFGDDSVEAIIARSKWMVIYELVRKIKRAEEKEGKHASNKV